MVRVYHSPVITTSAAMPVPPVTTTLLRDGWQFCRARPTASTVDKFDTCRPAGPVPTEIFTDLLKHSLIPDPFKEKNELLVQWVGEENWLYALNFPTPDTTAARHELVFEGLDTFATVTLNGHRVLKTENMFIPYRVDVTELLRQDSENRLEVEFESAYLKGKKLKERDTEFPWGCWNGDVSRTRVRKAQYHYGWDWGPILMTCGIWKPVYLQSYTTRIRNLDVEVRVEGRHRAEFTAVVTLEGSEGSVSGLKVELVNPDGTVNNCCGDCPMIVVTHGSDGTAEPRVSCVVNNPELWWPHGYGEQPLYTVRVTLGDGVQIAEKRVGVRTVRLVQRPLKEEEGLTFFLEINSVPMWVGGSNWIPADSFLTTVDKERERKWLQLARDGNQIMIRVWAGGVYESDTFYELCDEMGLLVWQDFAFGCGNYPAHIPEFRESVKEEAVANVKRLRHHPSLVVWAGNNEDYSYMWSIPGHLGYKPEDKNPENWLRTGFPARYLYEKIFPEAVAAAYPEDERIVYHRGCPYGNAERPDGWYQLLGDNHQWNVWHGTQEPYQNFDKLSGRFVSEFGMEAFPSVSTVESYLPENTPSEHHPFSSTVEHHNKADGAERRIATYLSENFKVNNQNLEAYIYATQLMQAEALASAYRSFRRNWKGPGREGNAGALVWQINDCWPVTSWAIIDYYLNPKLSYYAIKRQLGKVVLGSKRVTVKTPRDPYTDAHVDIEHKLQIWLSSFLLNPDADARYKVTARAFNIATGKILEDMVITDILHMPANRTVEIEDMRLPGWRAESPTSNLHMEIVVGIWVHDTNGRLVAREVSWPEPFKHVVFAERWGVRVGESEGGVWVEAARPVKGLELVGVEGLADQGVDLVPGERVRVGGKLTGDVKARWYGSEVAKTVEVVRE